MLNTYTQEIKAPTNIIMPTPCIGTLQKTHIKSRFVRFEIDSKFEEYVFDEKSPRIEASLDSPRIVVLQAMVFGKNNYLVEWVYEKDYLEK